MKLILRDYVASLRERRELDQTLVNLLIASGLRIVREPAHGQPEHGLDIAAVGPFHGRERRLVLVQVKQGDIGRSDWNSGPNAVRQSLDDLLDHAVSFQALTGETRKLPVTIVLAHNGQVQPNVQAAYEGYTKGVLTRYRIPIVHWGLDDLTERLSIHLLREELFSKESVSLLRRVLAYLEAPGYDLRHLVQLIDTLLPSSGTASPRDRRRLLLQVATILLMVEHGSRSDANDLGVAVRSYELGFLRLFGWLRRQKLLSDPEVQALLMRVLIGYISVSIELLGRLAPLIQQEDGLALLGTAEIIEYPLRCLNYGGLAAELVLLLLPLRNSPSAADALEFLTGFLSHFQKTASGATRPIFDHQLTDVALLAVALRSVDRLGDAQGYIRNVVRGLVLDKRRSLPLPEGSGNLESVGQLFLGPGKPSDYVDTSSCLLTALAELSVLLDIPDAFTDIRTHWDSGVNLQQWYAEEAFIDAASGDPPDLEALGSSEIGIDIPDDPAAFLRGIAARAHLDAPIRTGVTTIPFFEAAAYMTARVLHLRLPPFFWRRLAGSTIYADAAPPPTAGVSAADPKKRTRATGAARSGRGKKATPTTQPHVRMKDTGPRSRSRLKE